MIKRIRIQNYRSLIDVDVKLEPLTVLIGRSGTGKSNFVRAIRALRDTLRGINLSPFLNSEPLGSSKSILSFDVEFTNAKIDYQYQFQASLVGMNAGNSVSYSPKFEKFISAGKTVYEKKNGEWNVAPLVEPKPPISRIILANLNGIQEAAVAFQLLARGIGCYDFQGSVMQAQDSPNGIFPGLIDTGNNYIQTTSILRDDLALYGDWKSLTRSLAALNPMIKSADLKQPERNTIQIAYGKSDKTVVMDAATESEGFRRYFATLLALYQTPSKPLCMFEHPENGIHPGALESLANEFKRHVARGRGQVILTTHSPQFLEHFEPEQIRVVDIENQATKIGPLAPEQMEALKLNLLTPGELLTVDPARLEGQLAEVPA